MSAALTPAEFDEFLDLIEHAITHADPEDESIIRLAALCDTIRLRSVSAVTLMELDEFIFLTAAVAAAIHPPEVSARLRLLLDLFFDENQYQFFEGEQPLKALDAGRAILDGLQDPLAEYESGGYGRHAVRAAFDRSIGKAIAKLGFGPTKAAKDDPRDVDSEWLTLHFTDGTALHVEIELASLGTSFVVRWPGR